VKEGEGRPTDFKGGLTLRTEYLCDSFHAKAQLPLRASGPETLGRPKQTLNVTGCG
jgi:hypothetical protein